MKKMTKKQHREIIRGLVAKNKEVRDLRNIQEVAEIFQEEVDNCEKGMETLTAADCIRLLLALIDADLSSEAFSALYDVLEGEDKERDTVDDIIDVLELLNERCLKLVLVHVRAMAGLPRK